MKPASPVPGFETMSEEEEEEQLLATPAARVMASLVG